MPIEIRTAHPQDFDAIWPIFRETVSAGETYTYDRAITRERAFEAWMTTPRQTFVAELDGAVLGTYYIKTNHAGPGSHVCNCGYMVAGAARGQGVASRMCEHSQDVARRLGYRAMQFNFVVATNEGAVRLWKKLGFEIVGTVPRAFQHPSLGFVGAHVMYKWLTDD